MDVEEILWEKEEERGEGGREGRRRKQEMRGIRFRMTKLARHTNVDGKIIGNLLKLRF